MPRTVYPFDKDVFDLGILLREITRALLGQPLDTDRPIEDDGTPTPGNNLFIAFADALSGPDLTTLTNSVTAHPTFTTGRSAFFGFTPYSDTPAVYEVVTRFPYDGSDAAGIPILLTLVGGQTGGATASFRLFDVTNAAVIAEVTGVVAVSPSLINMGVISNIPTGPAIIELQALKTAGSNPTTVEVSGLAARF